MKNKRIWLIISALSVVFASCSKYEEKDVTESSPFDIKLEYTDIEVATETSDEIPDGIVTKQTLSGVKYEMHWDASDAVAVYNATKGELNRYVVKSGAGTKNAVFTPDGAAPSYDASDELYLIYPYDAASLEGDKLYLSIYRDEAEDSYSLSANKVFSRNDLLMSDCLTPASLSGSNVNTRNITLRRLVALVTLTTAVSHDVLLSESIERVRFKCRGVAGKSAVTFTDGVPSLTANRGSKNECAFRTLDVPNMASKDYLARFVPIFPVNMRQSPYGGFSFILESYESEVGFHRALNYTMSSNASVNYFLNNGLFGLDPVANESAATTDFSWWHENKLGGLLKDGSLYFGEANCVVMPAGQLSATLDVSLYEAGEEHARGSRSTQYQSPAAKARVIWYEEGDEESGLILNEPTLSNVNEVWTMTITASKNLGGNALIGLYDEDDNLLWSFHVWAPVSYEDVISNGFTANQFALGQVTSDIDTYLYYQWGRKDPLGRIPFPTHYINPDEYINMVAGDAPNAKTPSAVSDEGVKEGPRTLNEARLNPTVFYTVSSSPYDWASMQDDNLWNSYASTIYDPCPKGYHVPPTDLWSGIGDNMTNGVVTSSGLSYVARGSRRGKDGTVRYGGTYYGCYWSGSTSSAYGVYLNINWRMVTPTGENYRACGFAVRCVAEAPNSTPKKVLAHDDIQMQNGSYYYGETNCVVMPVGTNSTSLDVSLFKAGDNRARGSRSSKYLSAAAKAGIIWYEEGDENSGLILNEPTLSNVDEVWTMTVTASKNKGGNALIGLYDESDNLLWSFHVWAPATFEDVLSSNGITANQYALGQVTGTTDAYLYYQWGRKDPLGRAPSDVLDIDYNEYNYEHPHRLFSMTVGNAPNAKKPSLSYEGMEGVQDAPVSLDVVRRNPTVFYRGGEACDTYHWDLTKDDYLWNSNYKTIYDPCPKGYRITSMALWDGIEWGENPSTPPQRPLTSHNGITYTYGGRRSDIGTVEAFGNCGHYWSGSIYTSRTDGLSYDMNFNLKWFFAQPYRHEGKAVRCVKE